MRHGLSGRKFNRNSGQRRALLANLAGSLIKHQQIKTTLPKAKDLRPYIEKLVTIARRGDLHARRQVLTKISDREAVEKLMSDVAPRFAQRPGGYTRIIKAGHRYGDNAPMALIQFIDYEYVEPQIEEEAEGDQEKADSSKSA